MEQKTSPVTEELNDLEKECLIGWAVKKRYLGYHLPEEVEHFVVDTIQNALKLAKTGMDISPAYPKAVELIQKMDGRIERLPKDYYQKHVKNNPEQRKIYYAAIDAMKWAKMAADTYPPKRLNMKPWQWDMVLRHRVRD